MSFAGSDDRILPALKRMSDSHAVRGPDDEGYFLLDRAGHSRFYFGPDTPISARKKFNLVDVRVSESIDAFLGLSHRRLSILDLSDEAHQPMTSDESECVIVYNGEIYNYIELQNELIGEGFRFRSNSDTEVILAAYSRWGKKCVEKFNGDFAFAIWDSKAKLLFCARDRVGVKPFYYFVSNSGIVFGSDIKTIIASKLYKPQVSPEGIYYSMAYGMAPRPLTAFKDILALEPGTTLTVNEKGRIFLDKYWRVPTNKQNLNLSEQDAVDLLETALIKSTKLRMRSDVPVGTFMSGGVDSTLISALAHRESTSIRAFTLGYNHLNSIYDEVNEARLAADHIGIDHVVKKVDGIEVLPKIKEMVRLYEEPYYDLSPTLLISEEVKSNDIKVILNGLGGDEIFGGYGYYRYHNLPALNLPKTLSRLFQKISNEKVSKGLQLLASRDIHDLHSIAFRCSNDFHLEKLFSRKIHPARTVNETLAFLYLQDIDFTDRIEATCYLDLVNYIGNHFVHRVDQFTMFNSIEGRFPFLDHNVIEAGFAIPSKYKVKDGELKSVVKQLARKYIPKECISMKKKGFSLPLEHWMKQDLRLEVEKRIQNLMSRDLVNPKYIEKCFDQYLMGKISHYKIWHMVSLEMWLEEFID